MAASTVHLFLHRHQTIISHAHPRYIRPKYRKILMILIYLYFGGVAIPMYFIVAKDKTKALWQISEVRADLACNHKSSQKYPCFYQELLLPDTVLLDMDNFAIMFINGMIFVVLWIGLMIFFVSSSFCHMFKIGSGSRFLPSTPASRTT